jgi:hypothetical protein
MAAGHLLHGSRIRRPLRGRTASGGCGWQTMACSARTFSTLVGPFASADRLVGVLRLRRPKRSLSPAFTVLRRNLNRVATA